MTKKQEKPTEKQIIRPTSLDALNLRMIHVEIERPEDNAVLVIDLAPLSFQEWEEIGRFIPDPLPQQYGTSQGVKYDWDNLTFRNELVKASIQRMIYRLARSMDKAGQIFLPGETVQQKAEHLLKSTDSQIVDVLLTALEEMHTKRMAQVKTRAEIFRPNG